MNNVEFEKVFDAQVDRCRGILVNKAIEYAEDGDRLHNFRAAAGLTGSTPEEALAGMMLKHTVSVYDMCKSGNTYDLDLWNEKITDHLNYLFLLKAIIVEQKLKQCSEGVAADAANCR